MRVLEGNSNSWAHEGIGKEITFFEKEFAAYCERKYAVMLNSCLNSLYLLLKLQNISPGDEIITQPNIEPGDVTVALQAGARPVLADIEEDTLNLDPSQVEAKITDKTRAIIPIYAQGHPVDMDPIMELAEEHDLYVVEDCTHSTGAKYKGNRIPQGHVGIFGLYCKGFWLPGGGAMVVTDDKETVEKLKFQRSWDGRRAPGGVKDIHGNDLIHGLKIGPNDVDAAIGRVQLRQLDENIELQRKNAQIYSELLEDTPVIRPVEKDYAFHVFLRYVLRTEQRDALHSYLIEQGIDCHILYPTPAHYFEYYQETFGYKKGDFPVTEKVKKMELSLPEPRPRTQWELEYVATKIKEFFS